ncbi:MAG TPA: dihydrofolate reductase [Steroidobacteraceae bacterium]|nr:dihydrofolate reductase [Steroidobacteraceae bacterium]
MRVSLVVIASENGAIGKDNALLWRLPEDMKFFKAITMGKPVLMGRKTFETIGRPLPGRQNIVITRQLDWTAEGCTVVHSLEDALAAAAPADEAMVIGGADIYAQALPLATTIYLTRVHADTVGDVSFDFPEDEWHETHRERRNKDERHAHDFSFVTLNRNPT